ncbi:MAG: acyltransferase [Rubrivivax sp.]|nr:MAG: acyltransferase [Rubrivivax sp.]
MQAGYRHDIDGMRAIAVLAVVGFHLFPTRLTGGFAGVDVFFVISGYLITSLLIHPAAQSLEVGLWRFYQKRIHRIFPALIGVLAFCGLFGWFCLLQGEFQELSADMAAGSAFVANLLLWQQSGYFENAAIKKPLLHLWSLGIEEQFYIVLPCLVAMVRHRPLLMRTTLLALAVSSLLWCVHLSISDPTAAFYSPASRAFELLLGSLLACMPSWKSAPWGHDAMSVLGMCLIVAALVGLDRHLVFPGWWALLPTLGAALTLAAGPQAWLNRHVLSLRWLTSIGLISYPLYLWHWPLISFYQIVQGHPDKWANLMIMLVAMLLSIGTYLLVEKRWRHDLRTKVTTTLISLMAVLFLWGALGASNWAAPRHGNTELEKITAAIGEWDFPPADFQRYRHTGQDFFWKPAAPQRTLFIGDSHVQQYAPRVSEVLRHLPPGYYSALFATGSGCPPIVGVYEPARPQCASTIPAAYELALGPDIDRVVIGACWWCYVIDALRPDSTLHFVIRPPGASQTAVPLRGKEGEQRFMQALEAQLVSLSRVKKVYLLLDNPNDDSFDPKNFISGSRLSALHYHSPSAPFELSQDPSFMALRAQLTAMAHRLNITVIDPVDHLCQANACPSVQGGDTPIYKDRGHLRPSFVRTHAGFIDQVLAP